MKLYLHPVSPNCVAILAAAALLDIPLETEIVDAFQGQHRTPEYLAINPNGLFPVLLDDDFVLWEANAILQYLAAQKPGHALWPADNRLRADIARWQFWSVAHFTPAIQPFIYENHFKRLKGEGDPDPAIVGPADEKFRKYAAVLDAHLAERRYLVGDGLTLSDLSVASYLMYAEQARLPLDSYPNIRRWLAAIEALPAWRAALPQQ